MKLVAPSVLITIESSGLLPSGSQDSGSPVFSLSTNTNENLADCLVRKDNLDALPRTQISSNDLYRKNLLGARVIVEDVTNGTTIVPHVHIKTDDNNYYTREGENTSVCSESRIEVNLLFLFFFSRFSLCGCDAFFYYAGKIW